MQESISSKKSLKNLPFWEKGKLHHYEIHIRNHYSISFEAVHLSDIFAFLETSFQAEAVHPHPKTFVPYFRNQSDQARNFSLALRLAVWSNSPTYNFMRGVTSNLEADNLSLACICYMRNVTKSRRVRNFRGPKVIWTSVATSPERFFNKYLWNVYVPSSYVE